MDARAVRRFLKYVLVGGATFGFDLLLMFALVDAFGVAPVWAAPIAFLVAVSVNYTVSRRYVFRGTLRSVGGGYVGFLMIAGVGIAIVTGGMWVLVDGLGWNYLVSRILVAGLTGVWNYLLNLYVNFRVAGKHI